MFRGDVAENKCNAQAAIDGVDHPDRQRLLGHCHERANAPFHRADGEAHRHRTRTPRRAGHTGRFRWRDDGARRRDSADPFVVCDRGPARGTRPLSVGSRPSSPRHRAEGDVLSSRRKAEAGPRVRAGRPPLQRQFRLHALAVDACVQRGHAYRSDGGSTESETRHPRGVVRGPAVQS